MTYLLTRLTQLTCRPLRRRPSSSSAGVRPVYSSAADHRRRLRRHLRRGWGYHRRPPVPAPSPLPPGNR